MTTTKTTANVLSAASRPVQEGQAGRSSSTSTTIAGTITANVMPVTQARCVVSGRCMAWGSSAAPNSAALHSATARGEPGARPDRWRE